MHAMNQNPLKDYGPPAYRLGRLIRSGRLALLNDKGLSQRQFADLLGVRQGTVSKWENGALVPSSSDLAGILKHCDDLDPVECLRLLNEHREARSSSHSEAV